GHPALAARRTRADGPGDDDGGTSAGRHGEHQLGAGIGPVRRRGGDPRAVDLDAALPRARGTGTYRRLRESQRPIIGIARVAGSVAVEIGLGRVRIGDAVVGGIRDAVTIAVVRWRQRRACRAAAAGRVAGVLARRRRGTGREASTQVDLAEGRAVGRRAAGEAGVEGRPAAVAAARRGGGTPVATGGAGARFADAAGNRRVAARDGRRAGV